MAKLDLNDVEVWKTYAPGCQYSVRVLADKAKVSRSHMRRCAERLFHTTPQKVCDTIRMLAAPGVLECELSVKVATQKLRFKQQSQFSRIFKAFYGICPKQYLALPMPERLALKARVTSLFGLPTLLVGGEGEGENSKMNTTGTSERLFTKERGS